MKRLRVLLAGLAVIVFALAVLVCFMPARWALPWMQSRLHGLQLHQVEGTVWQGRAGQVSTVNGVALGSVAWTLSRRALFGDVQLGLDLQQPQWQLHGQMHRLSDTQQAWHDVTVQLDMAMLGEQAWLHGQPEGQLRAAIPQATFEGDWPMQVEAGGTWSRAAVRTAQGVIPLGALQLKIDGQAGVLKATLQDDGSGLVRTAGRLSFSPLGWDLQLNLTPRRDDPALLRWLHGFGSPAPDAGVQLRYRGGLAQLNSSDSSTGKP